VRTDGFAGILVASPYRRTGIGGALWDAVSAHLERAGATRIVAHGEADDESTAFVALRGFSLEGTTTVSAVDPATLGPPPEPPPGIGLAPLSRFAEDPERVFRADREGALDEPGPSDFSGMTFETWRREIWDNPDCDRELGLAVLVGGVVVGTSFLYSDREHRCAANAGTSVMRSFRGQGLALLMKRHSLAGAAAAGITRVVTQNDATNAPILAINAKLGYVPFAVRHAWVLETAPAMP
jgi:GNAT superfamily N-acetyltransferase